MTEIKHAIETVQEKIELACQRSGRKRESVRLIGVTKTQPVERILEAISCGIDAIGENRVQEYCEKLPSLPKTVEKHIIGHLQTNKVKYIYDSVDLIHSLDSVKLAKEIARWGQERGKEIPALIEVNVSGEESKFGLAPKDLDELIEEIEKMRGIQVVGLMTIPPKTDNPENSRRYFQQLYKIFIDKSQKKYNNIYMEHLSMGMSQDYDVAIEEGATMVRVGTAIFGTRS